MIKKISSFLQMVRRKGRRDSKRTGRPGPLWRDRRGAVAVYVVISAPVLLGIGALTLDLTRIMGVNTDLQSAADAAALAGAAELDRFAGAMDRARAAAKDAVANLQTFATGGADVTIDPSDCADPPVAPCIRFLKDLPASDDDPITAANLATTDAEARFIDVRIGARTVTNGLIRLVGGPATSTTSATAVAGNDAAVCGVSPLFMCDPSPSGQSIYDLHGQQVRLVRPEDVGGMFGPGNFGLICPPANPDCGADEIRDWLGLRQPDFCIGLNGLPTKPGINFGMVAGAINTRLDNWSAQVTAAVEGTEHGNWRFNPDFAPPRNVTQGGAPSTDGPKCLYSDLGSAEAMGLPRDASFNASNVGNGDWAWEEYFRVNHSDMYSPGQSFAANQPSAPSDWPVAFGWPPTRYETYRWELEKGVTANKHIVRPGQEIYNADGTLSGNVTAEDGESGNSSGGGGPPDMCATPGPDGDELSDAPTDKEKDQILRNDRRMITIAVVDCSNAQQEINGRTYVRPHAFVFAFLTETTDSEDEGLHLEIIRPYAESILNSFGHEIVQLYRR